MKRFLFLLPILIVPTGVLAQGVPYLNMVIGSNGKPVGGATITVCPSTGTGTPCSPVSSIFSEVTLITVKANPFTADTNGNYNFWASPGRYKVSITGSGITGRTDDVILPLDANTTSTYACIPMATGVLDAGCFNGADGGSKINVAQNALPSSGGVVDAMGLGAITIGTTLTLKANVWVRLSCGSHTLTSPAQIIIGNNSRLIGCGNDDVSPSTTIVGNHTTALITDGTGAAGWRVTNLTLDNTSNANVGGVLISASGGFDRRVIEDVSGKNCETGFSLPNSTYVEIVRPKFGSSCKTNISMGAATSAANSNFIFGGAMTGGQVGVDINGTGNMVTGTDMEGLSVAAVRIGNTVQASNGNVIALRFTQANAADILIVNAGGNSTGNQIIGAGSVTGAGVAGQMVLSPPSTAIIGGVNMNTTGVRSQKEWRVRNNGDVSLVLWDDSQAVGNKSWALENALGNLSIVPYDGTAGAFLQFIKANPQLIPPLRTADPTGANGGFNFRTDLNRLRYFDSAWHSIPGLDTTDVFSNKSTTAGPLAGKVASGTATMTTVAIASGACGTTVTVSATGALTTDAITFSFNAAPAANPAQLVVSYWPTANNVNFQYCNPTTGSITPNAATLNWVIFR